MADYVDPVSRLTLLLDADDTLWENNIYFNDVTEALVSALGAYGVTPDQVRTQLLETEHFHIERHGYGSRSFALSVMETYRILAPHGEPTVAHSLGALAAGIFHREEIELRPGARKTLHVLAKHHRLILVTKGDVDEQEQKLERSGLRAHFEWVEVVAEKNAEMYRELVKKLHLDPSKTWMIGNSPKSDINPAIAAGLHAVFIPHPHTWELELEEIDSGHDRLTIVDGLADLLSRFVPFDN